MKIINRMSMKEIEDLSYMCGIDDTAKTIKYLNDFARIYREAVNMLLDRDKKRIEYMKRHDILLDSDIDEFKIHAVETYEEVGESLDMKNYVRMRAAVEGALADAQKRHDKRAEEVMLHALDRINNPETYIKDAEE